jgi:pimeloyl-ACP methyl ester carboxylesterase
MLVNDIFHKLFRLTYKLHITNDTKSGSPVLFLHGIASDSATWDSVIALLPPTVRVITVDLLGFGLSPKPKHSAYSLEDHTKAVVKTIESLHINKPIVIVGHSMGGLLAIEIAKKYPKMVSRLVLISTPIYNQEDIIEATSKFSQTKKYFSNGLFMLYEKIINNEKPTFKAALTMLTLAPSANSFRLTKETWLPFKKSLENTIMRQTSIKDILQLSIPITLYYGKLDLLIQSKNYTDILNENVPTISVIKLNAAHMLTKTTAAIVAQNIASKNDANSNVST